MPPAHRQNDIGPGHGCHFPPSHATGGNPTVYRNYPNGFGVMDLVGYDPSPWEKIKDMFRQ